jgi:hypothetical protein
MAHNGNMEEWRYRSMHSFLISALDGCDWSAYHLEEPLVLLNRKMGKSQSQCEKCGENNNLVPVGN